MKKVKNYFEISNLNEYINCVTQNELGKYISRGENAKFKNITSSAFRYPSPIRFQDMTDNFYNEIGNTITDMQKENFTAFAQHHGMPTNLVDFSKSPLVSLFFACYETDKIINDSGYVHFINNKRLIDITEMLKYSNHKSSIFQNLIYLDSSVCPVILQLYRYEHTHIHDIEDTIIEWVNKLKNDNNVREKYKGVFSVINNFRIQMKKDPYYIFHDFTLQIINEIIKDNEKDCGMLSDFFISNEYIEKYYTLIEKINEFTQYNYFNDILLMLMLIRTVFGELFDCSSLGCEIFNSFNLPFYFTYSPPNILSRIENQSSLFIYQLFYDDDISDPYIDNIGKRATQNILPDFTIKVNNKEEILRSLDSLGINLKFIYNDYDNIAKYIKTKGLGSF